MHFIHNFVFRIIDGSRSLYVKFDHDHMNHCLCFDTLQIVRIWGNYEDGNYACGHILKDHSAKVRMKFKNLGNSRIQFYLLYCICSVIT